MSQQYQENSYDSKISEIFTILKNQDKSIDGLITTAKQILTQTQLTNGKVINHTNEIEALKIVTKKNTEDIEPLKNFKVKLTTFIFAVLVLSCTTSITALELLKHLFP